MSSCKYRVEQNGHFLGHHSGRNLKVIIDKAVDRYGRFYPIDTNSMFTLSRGQRVLQVDINGQEC